MSDNTPATVDTSPAAAPLPAPAQPPARNQAQWLLLVALLAGFSLLANVWLWNKLSRIQNNLAEASAQAKMSAEQAKLLANTSNERSDATQARLALVDARLDDLQAQSAQVDALLQNAARTQSDELLSSVDSNLRMAQQQAQFTGNAQTLIDALRQAQARLAQAGEGSVVFKPVANAIARDIERLQTTSYPDIPLAVQKIDALMEIVDQIPLLADRPRPAKAPTGKSKTTTTNTSAQNLGQKWLQDIWQEARTLVQIQRVDQPAAALITPEQAYFVRENIKLQLLSARAAFLSRRLLTANTTLAKVQRELQTYADVHTAAYAKAQTLLAQASAQSALQGQDSLPALADSTAAIAAANARYRMVHAPASAPVPSAAPAKSAVNEASAKP